MLTAEITLERYTKKGQLLQSLKQKSRSFLKQFIQLIEAHTNQVAVTITDITGTARTVNPEDVDFFSTPGGGHGYVDPSQRQVQVENVGIVLGTGTTSPTPTDHKLETKIAHGKGSGQLLHLGSALYPVVVSAPDAYVDLIRFFENQSGASITINEIGIYALAHSAHYGVCICRDVLSTAVTVANGELLKARYRIKVSVS